MSRVITLDRWFVTPVSSTSPHPSPTSLAPSSRGPIRVWGYVPDGRLWRSSSIQHAPSPRRLTTRYNTTVILMGPLDRAAAAAAALPAALIALFTNGFPKAWRSAVESRFRPTHPPPPSEPTEAVGSKRAAEPAEPAWKKRRSRKIQARKRVVTFQHPDHATPAHQPPRKPAAVSRPPLPPSTPSSDSGGDKNRGAARPRSSQIKPSSRTPPGPVEAVPAPSASRAEQGTREPPIPEQDSTPGLERDQRQAPSRIASPEHKSSLRSRPVRRRARPSGPFAIGAPATPEHRPPEKPLPDKNQHLELPPLPAGRGDGERRPKRKSSRRKQLTRAEPATAPESGTGVDIADRFTAGVEETPKEGKEVESQGLVSPAELLPRALVHEESGPGMRTSQPLHAGDDESDVDFPGTPLLKDAWTQEQLAAFDHQRTIVPPGAKDYWALVAAGVPGKSMADCTSFWESKWSTPGKVAASMRPTSNAAAVKSTPARPPKPGTSTPEVAAKMATANPAARKTAKYKTNLRRVAAAISRDCDDDALEPPLSNSEFQVLSDPQSLDLATELKRGTPDTAAKSKRAAAERLATSQTPEILTRGRSFGLQEADNYLSLFNRRRGAVNSKVKSTSTPPLPVSAGNVGDDFRNESIEQSSQPVDDFVGPEARAIAEADDGASSDDSGIFF